MTPSFVIDDVKLNLESYYKPSQAKVLPPWSLQILKKIPGELYFPLVLNVNYLVGGATRGKQFQSRKNEDVYVSQTCSSRLGVNRLKSVRSWLAEFRAGWGKWKFWILVNLLFFCRGTFLFYFIIIIYFCGHRIFGGQKIKNISTVLSFSATANFVSN